MKSWEHMFTLESFPLQSDSPRQGVGVEVSERKCSLQNSRARVCAHIATHVITHTIEPWF